MYMCLRSETSLFVRKLYWYNKRARQIRVTWGGNNSQLTTGPL